MTKEEILKQVAALKAESKELWNDIDEHSKEEKRVTTVLHNAESIINYCCPIKLENSGSVLTRACA